MSTWLLEIAIGPVQGFIAAARRSRDLWAGSHLLSELVRATALHLLDNGAQLIYPLAARVRRASPDENSNLSNILLAEVDAADEAAVRELARAAQDEARAHLRVFADNALDDWQSGSNGARMRLREDFWTRQVEDAIDSYAAWARVAEAADASGDGRTPYRIAYDKLKGALAARRHTRDFAPMFPPAASDKGAGIPKCSFDGLRESVLPELPAGESFPARFGVAPGEQLDALGCIKRVVGRNERFTALSRFAAHGWLGGLDDKSRSTLCAAYKKLLDPALNLATGALDTAHADFPYDGGLLFPERIAVAEQERRAEPAALAALAELRRTLRPIWRDHGQPCPYAVLVIADGDRMGRLVDRARSAEEHERISRAVAAFADRVPGIAREVAGQCVFAGGDDLTLYFPLAGVVHGAFDLHDAFTEALAEVVGALPPPADGAPPPTLRVGAAICHVLEPLAVIRQRAADAERLAKGEGGPAAPGNALGLLLSLRSGPQVGLRLCFADAHGRAALDHWQAAYAAHRLPGRLAFDTRAIGLHCRAIGAGAGVAEGEFLRLLARARQGGGGERIDDATRNWLAERQAALAPLAGADDPGALHRLGDELILARWLAARSAAEIGAFLESH
ncbi:type III-B CRISPR-associated protein Cas10/Cmr2 [Accumulibacter sp.]|uniref:Cas10/Cmr2 second palm domain-containing protein n=1 Tax=Accumulibacter sp. TaxID=2053492 RepID=UPI00261BEF3E|nr:type III-B CRISPR-associated protein Cas10/Cmr2 [Accumulibacter sp.]